MEHILVVDDDSDIRDMIMDYFGSEYIVTLANDGTEGFRIFQEHMDDHPIHLILTDVMMPNLDGVELAEKVRAVVPDMPIIAISGHPELDKEKVKIFSELYSKPFNFSDVYHKINEYLNQ